MHDSWPSGPNIKIICGVLDFEELLLGRLLLHTGISCCLGHSTSLLSPCAGMYGYRDLVQRPSIRRSFLRR